MITHPNCKINLGLHILGRRPDGYHNLETVFLPVHTLCDELELTATDAPTATITQQGIALDSTPADNLCLRAWQLMHDRYGIPPVHIRLDKRIPFGAGLGGGSSDAAFTLKMLDSLFHLGLDTTQLEHLASHLGADCAFFIQNRPAYATGIGDQLQPIALHPALAHCHIDIAIPEGEHVSTKEAYAGLHRQPACTGAAAAPTAVTGTMPLGNTPRPSLPDAMQRPIEEWRTLVYNDFEVSVFPAHPAIAALKDNMYRRGALYASMSGSGAAVYGLFPSAQPSL